MQGLFLIMGGGSVVLFKIMSGGLQINFFNGWWVLGKGASPPPHMVNSGTALTQYVHSDCTLLLKKKKKKHL